MDKAGRLLTWRIWRGENMRNRLEEREMLSQDILTAIVRQARCQRCDGNGFRRVPKEDHRGERIPGFDKIDCQECHGNGIKLSICWRLAAEAN
jgi:DnaJ-class molecular chaperone